MTDDELTLYYYDDGLDAAERQAVARALESDPGLAGRYRKLSAELDALPDPLVPAPSAETVSRWRDAFDRAAGPAMADGGRRIFDRWSFAVGAALTAALAIGIGLGFVLGNGDRSVHEQTAAIGDDISIAIEPSAVFLRGLRTHLRESRSGLATLPGDDAGMRVLVIADLLEQNRRYERAAELNDADRMARVLRAFELVLRELASRELSAAEAEALRAELLFQLDVVLTKLKERPSDAEQAI